MDDKKFDEAIKVLVMLRADVIEQGKKIDGRINEQQRALSAVSYTHLTLPTNREV